MTSQALRILVVARDDDQTRLIRSAFAASTNPRFEVVYAANRRQAHQQAADGVFDALVVDHGLGDGDAGTLIEQLKASDNGAPALLLTPTAWDDTAPGSHDDHLPRTEALNGDALIRAIAAMVQRHNLQQELAAARDQVAHTTNAMAELTHDLATPLGVVMGMSHALLLDDSGLNEDGRACLEDIAREARRATEILKRASEVQHGASPVAPAVAQVPDVGKVIDSRPGSKIVLIADDDPATRRLICATLDSDRYTLIQAADGAEAWQLIREHRPAVAILDWQMPVYSGLELTDVIKGDPQLQGMTVIMLTGRSTQADREAGARAQADRYLIKPFLPEELLGAVEQALGVS